MSQLSFSAKTLGELAQLVGGKIKGDPEIKLNTISVLQNAKPGSLSFLTNPQYRQYLETTEASVVVMGFDNEKYCPARLAALFVKEPRLALAKIAKMFEQHQQQTPGIHPTAIIGHSAKIHSSAAIGPYVVIGDEVELEEGVVIEAGCVLESQVQVGARTLIKSRVTLCQGVKLGSDCVINSGAVIGSTGFGFAQEAGEWIRIPHLGHVVIGNHVQIGANTTIDRGVVEDTEIDDGVIIDNLVVIAHNVKIGKNTAIAGCVAIAGSAKIGAQCLIGGAASIGGHLEICDNVAITATSGLNQSITEPGVYSSGMPAKPNAQWRRNIARFQYLDEMAKRLRALEKRVEEKVNDEQSE